MSLAGKVAVVTGGSRGIGREIVLGLAARGAAVVVAARRVEACEALAATVRESHGVPALAAGVNVGVWGDCDLLVESAYREFGHVDILVNNAGMSPLYPSLDQVGEALFDKVLAVNLRGPFRLSSVIGARMAAAGGGSIINISSAEAVSPDPSALPYAAAKAGLNTLTCGMAAAFGPTVRVNAVQCGPFLTDIADAWTPEVRSTLERRTALGRCGRPDEVVGAVLYLVGDDSSYCTGAVLPLDGGLR